MTIKKISPHEATYLQDGDKVIVEMPKIGFTVLAECNGQYAIGYTVYRDYKFQGYDASYETESGDFVDSLELEESWLRPVVLMSGFVKCDGCSEWNGLSDHFCDGDVLLNIGKVLHECYNLTSKFLECWD